MYLLAPLKKVRLSIFEMKNNGGPYFLMPSMLSNENYLFCKVVA